ncbi:three component ABC system middle component [Jatrophihabitans sp. DSM 45814]
MTRRNSRHEPPEVATLLNPALIALLLSRATNGYQGVDAAGMPYIYAPIVATIALYPDARATLSMNVTTKFTSWAMANDDMQLSLQSKIAGMVPIVNEGLLFALRHDVLKLSAARFTSGSHGPTKVVRSESSDVTAAQRAAVYLGRWLAHAGQPSTVCAILGVTP